MTYKHNNFTQMYRMYKNELCIKKQCIIKGRKQYDF